MSRLVVLCTVGKAEDAEWIAREVVERHLAACVNVLPPMTSVYRWKGEIERNEEVLLVIKTTADRFEALREAIVSMHNYELPEVDRHPDHGGPRPVSGLARCGGRRLSRGTRPAPPRVRLPSRRCRGPRSGPRRPRTPR